MIGSITLRLLAGASILLAGSIAARADSIDTVSAWSGISSMSSYGTDSSAKATYGQIITPGATQRVLQNFTFQLMAWGGDFSSNRMQAFVYRWDPVSQHITGSALYGSQPFPGPTSKGSFQPVVVSTGNLALTPGQQYVLFLTTSTVPDQEDHSYALGYVSGSTYAGGRHVQASNGSDFSQLLTTAWYIDSDNLAFIAQFGIGMLGNQIAAELTLQAAEQGVILTQAQTGAIVNQLRNRLGRSGADATGIGGLPVSAFAEAGDSKAAKAFSHVTLTGAAVAQGRWTAWTDTSADGFHANWNPDIDGYQFRQQFGLDYRFPNGWVAGAGIGVSAFNNDFENSGSLSGNSYWIEPYLGMDVGGWLIALQGAYTYSDYRTFDTGLGLSDSAHGNRLSGSLTVSRQYDFPSGFYVAPEASIAAGTESMSNLKNLGSGPVSVKNASFLNTSFGGEFGYNLPHGGRVYGLALAEYTDTSGDGAETYLSTGYQASRWSATLGGGFDARVGDKMRVGLEGKVRGAGSDTLIYGGSARLSVSF